MEERVRYLHEHRYLFAAIFKFMNLIFIAFVVGFLVMMALDCLKGLLFSSKLLQIKEY